jgi:hypothetical protein
MFENDGVEAAIKQFYRSLTSPLISVCMLFVIASQGILEKPLAVEA